MSIPQRHIDGRASDLSRKLCDIVLEQIAVDRRQEPQLVEASQVNLYQVGAEFFALRAFTRSKGGNLWTNIRPSNLRILEEHEGIFIGIAFDPAVSRDFVIYHISPDLLTRHLEVGHPPLGNYGQWSLHIRPEGDNAIRLTCGAHLDVVEPNGGINRFERRELTNREYDAIRGLLREEAGVRQGNEAENAVEL